MAVLLRSLTLGLVNSQLQTIEFRLQAIETQDLLRQAK